MIPARRLLSEALGGMACASSRRRTSETGPACTLTWTLLDQLGLEHPLAQAGMGVAWPEAGWPVPVAAAGGLGALVLPSAAELREAIQQCVPVRRVAPLPRIF